MNTSFNSAIIKLTLWYLVIIMLVSLVFSTVIFQVSDQALTRGFSFGDGPGQRALVTDLELFETLRTKRAQIGRDDLLQNLAFLNLMMLVGGGAASYLLAKRTLTPMHDAMAVQSRFISDASHELRTPLTAMRTEIEVALRGASSTKGDYKQALASSLEEVESLQKLSDNLLLLTSDGPLVMENIPLDAITSEAIQVPVPE